ncbi:nitroreductase [Bacillus sp. X1(2014)]|uniref:nitroreductase family protein n=1 Tax=Bacillus sp. X1(2014) TaxID=1565991 RepID=UPI0011A2A2A4|nr:nitroreductase [Bacillus sp. X1(2014)]
MNTLDAIKTRRNIKKFKSMEIEQNLILAWLEAATMAPNHRMTEPWEIYFIGTETREKLNHKTNFGNAPVVLMILSKQGATTVETEENAMATACFIQNFNLAAWAEGVGTFWSSIGITPKNREILRVPDGFDIIGVLGVGYPEVIPDPKPRTPIQNKISNLP